MVALLPLVVSAVASYAGSSTRPVLRLGNSAACSRESARCAPAAMTDVLDPIRADASKPTEADEERLRTVCVALLGRCGKVDDALLAIDADGSGDIDEGEFANLLDQLEIVCTPEDSARIFATLDEDSSGTLDARELKEAVRSSGAIQTMYQQGVSTFGTLLAITLAFDAGVWALKGSTDALDFLTAYVVEDSLSVDNLFVFLLIFRYFKVPPQLVDTCLNYGIAGAIVLRGFFIFVGLAAVNAFSPVLFVFSGFLLFSSYQLLAGDEGDDDEDEIPEVVTGLLEKLPLSGTFEGEKFFTSGTDGTGTLATQLTATLTCIALCDVIFAVDSIPAVLAINDDPFVIYSSNIAAVLGLRSLYQLLSVAVSDLVYLEKAVAIVLGFVGLKLGLEVCGVEVSSGLSLGVIFSTLSGGVLLSLSADADDKDDFEPAKKSAFLSLWTKVLGAVRGGGAGGPP